MTSTTSSRLPPATRPCGAAKPKPPKASSAGKSTAITTASSQAPATEAIKRLLLEAESVRLQEVARITQQFAAEPLSPQQIASVERLTKSLTSKLLHPQIAALRERGASLSAEGDSSQSGVEEL